MSRRRILLLLALLMAAVGAATLAPRSPGAAAPPDILKETPAAPSGASESQAPPGASEKPQPASLPADPGEVYGPPLLADRGPGRTALSCAAVV